MKLRKAQRLLMKMRLAIQGPSGSGKTYSALLLSQGLTDDLSKVCVIDTENGSADLYSHLGEYSIINPGSPAPESYIKAIEIAEMEGIDVCIIDSLSHAWEYLLEYHSSLTGNSFANWAKVTPRHQSLLRKILESRCHIIATLRVKQDYVLNDKGNGKLVPEKVGLKAVQRDGVDYEFTTVFDLDMRHQVKCSKDRTGLFMEMPEFVITPATGTRILEWCEQGVPAADNLKARISACKTMRELLLLYEENRALSETLHTEFSTRKHELSPLNLMTNGHP